MQETETEPPTPPTAGPLGKATGGARPMRSPRASLIAGGLIAALLCAAAVCAPLIAPHDPVRQELSAGLEAPAPTHPLGRDKLGRDQLSRILYGARVSLAVGVITVFISLTIGLAVGLTAGYYGGAIDFWFMRVVDVLMAFPGILLAIAMSAALRPGLGTVVVALSVIGWTGYARLARGEVLGLRNREHVEAARALGSGDVRILARHILPLLAGPLAVQATFGLAGAIVAEASLSFLGLGVQPPTPSWGAMLNDGRAFLLIAPHLTLYPGLAVVIAVLGLNLLGDGLRDLLDVRST